MIIAVDFDGTIVEHAYPLIGKPIPFATDVLKMLQKDGHILILWTVREGELLQEAIDYCEKNGLTFYAANKSFPEEQDPTPRKLSAVDLFIDDRNLGGLPDWGVIYKMIKNEASLFDFDTLVSNEKESGKKRKKNIFLRIGEAIEKSKGNSY